MRLSVPRHAASTRARAAETLGRWPQRDERVREALQRAAQDENPSVRAAAESGLRALAPR